MIVKSTMALDGDGLSSVRDAVRRHHDAVMCLVESGHMGTGDLFTSHFQTGDYNIWTERFCGDNDDYLVAVDRRVYPTDCPGGMYEKPGPSEFRFGYRVGFSGTSPVENPDRYWDFLRSDMGTTWEYAPGDETWPDFGDFVRDGTIVGYDRDDEGDVDDDQGGALTEDGGLREHPGCGDRLADGRGGPVRPDRRFDGRDGETPDVGGPGDSGPSLGLPEPPDPDVLNLLAKVEAAAMSASLSDYVLRTAFAKGMSLEDVARSGCMSVRALRRALLDRDMDFQTMFRLCLSVGVDDVKVGFVGDRMVQAELVPAIEEATDACGSGSDRSGEVD